MTDEIQKALNIGIILLLILAVLFILINAMKIWYYHKKYEKKVGKVTRKLIGFSENAGNCNDVFSIITARKLARSIVDPWFHKISKRISKPFSKKTTRYKIRWFLDYISYRPSLMILTCGVFGISFVYMQLFIIDVVTKDIIPSLAQTIAMSTEYLIQTVTGMHLYRRIHQTNSIIILQGSLIECLLDMSTK